MDDSTVQGKLTPEERRQVAAVAMCDPRIVGFYEQGRPQASTTTARLEAALRAKGLLERVRVTRAAALAAKAAG